MSREKRKERQPLDSEWCTFSGSVPGSHVHNRPSSLRCPVCNRRFAPQIVDYEPNAGGPKIGEAHFHIPRHKLSPCKRRGRKVLDRVITSTPGVCDGSSCIANTRIPVWLLVSFKSQGMSDKELLVNYPTITQGQLEATWRYYNRHKEEIDQEILDQDKE